MRRIIAIRPEPGLSASVRAGCEAGLEIEGFPLFEIRPVAWQAPGPSEIDGLLIGSANAIRHAGDELGRFAGKPVFAVGQATAAVAEQAGLRVELAGRGGLQQVVDSLGGRRLRLLRLCAPQHVPLRLSTGISLVTRIVYEPVALPMPPALAAMLRDGGVVLLHSGEAARHFAGECDRLGIDRAGLRLAALGEGIAAAGGTGWADARWASGTSEEALLALARDMCQ